MNAKSHAITPVERLAVRVEEAAEILGIGRSMLFILLKEGRLKSVKIGKRRLIPMLELEAFLLRQG
ncbi:hypothetical protein GETHOR_23550 [Geothrix oryzae]|uniref:Helix-turn-helix domain-containing protein n=1 Tax=Geothrix oryzae TaxID=2927975 RepID=A0ABN6UYV8_9BACT|nr:helix-turn-helix domain-containing protein [Geothrix oryzae]BDU70254.1 hypothetical protein GETHOR_23550 [Geothrix oryzae]